MPKKAAGSNTDVDSVIKGLIASLDAQIAELAQKKAALVNAFGGSTATAVVAAPAATAAAAGVRRRGRPPGSANKKGTKVATVVVVADKPAKKGKKKRVFSEETKRKLAVKAKARWAKIRAEQGQG